MGTARLMLSILSCFDIEGNAVMIRPDGVSLAFFLKWFLFSQFQMCWVLFYWLTTLTYIWLKLYGHISCN